MAYSSNNSRNVANLLRYEPLQPIQPRRQQQIPPPEPIIQSTNNIRARNQIPIEDVFTPEEGVERRTYKRKTPLSSGNGGQGQLFPTNNGEDFQIQSLKVRLEQIVKYYDERHRNLQANLSERLSGLENLVIKEMPKVDNTNVMKADFVSFKQSIRDMRKQMQYQNQQLVTLKAIVEQRSFSDALIANDAKQKEKMTVLFMEVVRLSDMVEKMQSGVGSIGRNYQLRLQQLEHKLANSQKNLSLMAQRSNNGNQFISQFGDKVMDRLQTAENNLLTLGHERIKDKQTVNQLLVQSDRMTENLQNLLRTMQGDFQNKLQNRISETINRLIAEHEERVNAQQQIRRNLDIRQRMTLQKQNNDKQEFRARYQNMDIQIRNQFQRKQQSIRQLQGFIQNQVKNVQKEILIQASNRKEQQSVVRTEIKRLQDSFRKEYDLYKTHQSDVLQRIGELVKEQVQVRVNSQINLKKLTSDIANQLVNDLNGVKEAISSSNRKLSMSIKQVANDSSERAGQLSHYVDQQVKKVVEVVTQKYNKMKSVFTKLAQQLRQHLTNTETNRVNVEKRLSILEDNFEKLKSEVNSQIQQFYKDLQQRLKDEKEYVETAVFKKNNDLTIRVNKLEEYVNQYFELLKGNIEQNKQILNNKLGSQQGRSPQSEQQMKQLREIVFNIKALTEEIKNENKVSLEEFRREMKLKQTQNRQGTIEKQNQLREKIEKHTSQIAQIQQSVGELTVKVNSLRADGKGPDATISNDKLKKINDQLDAINKKIKSVEDQSASLAKTNEQEIIKLRTDITVLKGEVGALDDDIKKLSNS